MCDSGKWETFCERSKKEQSARKISRCARNDGIGGIEKSKKRRMAASGFICFFIPRLRKPILR